MSIVRRDVSRSQGGPALARQRQAGDVPSARRYGSYDGLSGMEVVLDGHGGFELVKALGCC